MRQLGKKRIEEISSQFAKIVLFLRERDTETGKMGYRLLILAFFFVGGLILSGECPYEPIAQYGQTSLPASFIPHFVKTASERYPELVEILPQIEKNVEQLGHLKEKVLFQNSDGTRKAHLTEQLLATLRGLETAVAIQANYINSLGSVPIYKPEKWIQDLRLSVERLRANLERFEKLL